jgi:hypothetical protein
LTPLGVSERVVSTVGIIQAKLTDRKRSGASRKFSPAVKGRQSISPANFTGTEVPWKSCGAHERVRSASLENLIRCCLLWGEEATRLAALSAGLFFLGGRRSSRSQLGKGAISILSACAANHTAAQAYRFRLEEADRRLPSSFTRTSIQSLDWAAEGLLPADSAAVAPAHGNAGRRIRILSAAEAGLRAGGAEFSLAAWSRGNSI